MKKNLLLLVFAMGQSFAMLACTTFFINKDGRMIFGRNYDWVTGSGMVFTNQRGLSKTSDKTSDGLTISWVSKYGSITFNQYGKEFPTGGMNEEGLVVELMWLDGTRYPAADARPAVEVLQWIQYQLDNCKTVTEVIATDKVLRIANGTPPLHYLVADAKGGAATIEFLDGKLVVHQGKDLPFPVLTNDSYASALNETTGAMKMAGSSHAFTNNSVERFSQACKMVSEYQNRNIDVPLVDYSFTILRDVAQGSHTKWSIVYDISNRAIHFKTLENPNTRDLTFSNFDFSCRVQPKSFEMSQSLKGDINNHFLPYTQDHNRKLVERSFEESKSQFTVPPAAVRAIWEYAGNITCNK